MLDFFIENDIRVCYQEYLLDSTRVNFREKLSDTLRDLTKIHRFLTFKKLTFFMFIFYHKIVTSPTERSVKFCRVSLYDNPQIHFRSN